MSESLNVIGLISGGKDSLFSLLHCVANGHNVIALANLYPEAPSTSVDEEDIDSQMYQTVGHTLIPIYSLALGLPLYRHPISGSATNASKDYKPPDLNSDAPDETESLIPLLLQVKAAYPMANAVCTGAILSTYQRTRVESVALRLGLTPLSYLWQYPYLPPYEQMSLLQDMAAVGMIAKIIKVASAGLDSSFLGQNVAEPKVMKRLWNSMRRFAPSGKLEAGAVLGEGGEFETLSFSGPTPLWEKDIRAEIHKEANGEGGSAFMRFKNPTVVDKEETSEGIRKLRTPDLWDDWSLLLLEKLQEAAKSKPPVESNILNVMPERKFLHVPLPGDSWSQGVLGKRLYVWNMVATCGDNASVEQQMDSLLERLSAIITKFDLKPSSIIFSTLLLRSMADFKTINDRYSTLFAEPNPPARVTVACGDLLPQGVDVTLSVLVDMHHRGRRALHVQSRSYWAPANIGPYSQAYSVRVPAADELDESGLPVSDKKIDHTRITYVSGQIPLVPASMELLDLQAANQSLTLDSRMNISVGQFEAQPALALQHLTRIGCVKDVDVHRWAYGVAFISACPRKEANQRAHIAATAWSSLHEISEELSERQNEEEDIDPWDLQNRQWGHEQDKSGSEDTRPERLVRTTHEPGGSRLPVPPCFIVQVEELPRGADIEWTAVGFNDCEVQQVGGRTFSCNRVRSCTIVPGYDIDFLVAETLDELWKIRGHCHPLDGSHRMLYLTPEAAMEGREVAQIVPCRRLWNQQGKRVMAVLIVGNHSSSWDPI